MEMHKIHTFVKRLEKLGINVELISNYPWVYLHKVNGNLVKEKHYSEYGFCIGLQTYVNKKEGFNFNNLKQIFNTIRYYK